MNKPEPKPRIVTRVRGAGPDHQVVTVMAVANGVPADDPALAACRD